MNKSIYYCLLIIFLLTVLTFRLSAVHNAADPIAMHGFSSDTEASVSAPLLTPVEPPLVTPVEKLEFDLRLNYPMLMLEAAIEGDIELGREYGRLYGLREEYLGNTPPFTFDDLYLLAKVVDVEAGSSWIETEHKKLVASVVMNRINSPEFPDNMYDVVYQNNQYAASGTERFENLIPRRASVEAAFDVLQNGSIAPKSVVFQAEFKQGSKVYKTFSPKLLGTTYFCHSSKPELYN